MDAILLFVFGGGFAVFSGIASILHPHDVPPSYDPAIAVGTALAAVLCVLGIVRGWRMGVRIDDDGVLVRNFFRTYRLGWPEVTGFQDGVGWRVNEGLKREWRLRIVLREGGAVLASATSWSPKAQTALKQAAERYGVPAELTGVVPSTSAQALLR